MRRAPECGLLLFCFLTAAVTNAIDLNFDMVGSLRECLTYAVLQRLWFFYYLFFLRRGYARRRRRRKLVFFFLMMISSKTFPFPR